MSAIHDHLTLMDPFGRPMPPPHDHAVPVAEAMPLDGGPDDLFAVASRAAMDDPDKKVRRVKLPEGCYRLTYRPRTSSEVFRGTLRVDRAEGNLVISGDLYRFLSDSDSPNAATISALPFGTRAKRLRMKCTRQRCQAAPSSTALMAAFIPA
jgi:hypothetical protein